MNIYEEVHSCELIVFGYIFVIFFENKEIEMLIYFLKER